MQIAYIVGNVINAIGNRDTWIDYGINAVESQ